MRAPFCQELINDALFLSLSFSFSLPLFTLSLFLFSLFLFLFVSLLLFPLSPSRPQSVGVLRLFCPRPCLSTCQWTDFLNPLIPRDHTLVCSPCSYAIFGRCDAACVSSPRDWAVSVGSHMQQDIGVSRAPPHASALLPLLEAVDVIRLN